MVVLGGSKSATDIAVNAVNSGASEVTIVFREPVWRIPYFVGGLVNFKRILYIRAQEQMFASWGIGPLARLAHVVAKPFVWANWRGLESMLKMQLKLKQCGMVPKERIEDGVNCSVPIATPGFYPMVADGRIKAVWIISTNPVVSLPDADRARAALDACELVVVTDCMRDTDTTRHADVLLPALAWGEKDGTVTNSERRISRQRPFLSAPGEARADWRIICDVAIRMGYAGFDYASAAEVFREHAELSGFENDGRRDFDISALAALEKSG